jgi:hypothetical protein
MHRYLCKQDFYLITYHLGSVGIQVRIGPPHLPEATEWGGPSDETGKTEVPCHSRCGTIKILPCSRALRAEHRPKFCSLSPAMVIFISEIFLSGM